MESFPPCHGCRTSNRSWWWPSILVIFKLEVGTEGLRLWLSGKESTCQAGDVGSVPGSGRSPGEGNGNPLEYSGLENPMDRGAWQATAPKVTKSRTWLSDEQAGREWELTFCCWESGWESESLYGLASWKSPRTVGVGFQAPWLGGPRTQWIPCSSLPYPRIV